MKSSASNNPKRTEAVEAASLVGWFGGMFARLSKIRRRLSVIRIVPYRVAGKIALFSALMVLLSLNPTATALASTRSETLKNHLSQPEGLSVLFRKVVRNRPKIVIADEEIEISDKWVHYRAVFASKSFHLSRLRSFTPQELALPIEKTAFMSGVYGGYCWRASEDLFYRYDFPASNPPLASLLSIEKDKTNPVTIPCFASYAILAQTINLGLDAIEVGSFKWDGNSFMAQGFDGMPVSGKLVLSESGLPKELVMKHDGFLKDTVFVSELFYATEGDGRARSPRMELPIRFDQFWLVNGHRQLIQEIEITENPNGERWNTVEPESMDPTQFFGGRKFRNLHYRNGQLTEPLAGGIMVNHSNLLFAVGRPVESSISSLQRIVVVSILILTMLPIVFWIVRRKSKNQQTNRNP